MITNSNFWKALMILIILSILFAWIIFPPRIFENGFAWDIGGMHYNDSGILEVFVCADNYSPRWPNPLADLFPQLVVDC